MSYLIINQDQQILDKNLEWMTACTASSAFCTPHKDVALNQLIEINSRDITLRARVVECELDNRGQPMLSALDCQTSNQPEPVAEH